MSEDEADIAYNSGFTPRLSLELIPALIKSIAIHSCVVPIKAELDHLCEGLNLFGMYDLIKLFPDLMKDLFVMNKGSNVTTSTFISLFEINFSPDGFNAREAEEATVFYWYKFLNDVQNGLVG